MLTAVVVDVGETLVDETGLFRLTTVLLDAEQESGEEAGRAGEREQHSAQHTLDCAACAAPYVCADSLRAEELEQRGVPLLRVAGVDAVRPTVDDNQRAVAQGLGR